MGINNQDKILELRSKVGNPSRVKREVVLLAYWMGTEYEDGRTPKVEREYIVIDIDEGRRKNGEGVSAAIGLSEDMVMELICKLISLL